VTIIFNEQKDIVAFQNHILRPSLIVKENVYFYSIDELAPGKYDCRFVVRNLETGRGGTASTTVTIPDISDSGFQVYPPLLLIPGKDVYYIKGSTAQKDKSGIKQHSIFNVYPFDYNKYHPLIEELNRDQMNLAAAVRCSIMEIQQPQIQLSAYLINLSSGERTPLSLSILEKYQDKDTQIYIIDLLVGELKAGKYVLYLHADELNTKITSHSRITFMVR